MKLKLIHKLLIAMFASTALVLVLVSFLSSASIGRGFEEFLQQQERNQVAQLVPELSEWYLQRGGWQGLSDNPREFLRFAFSILLQGAESGELREQAGNPGMPRQGGRGPGGPPNAFGGGRPGESLRLGPGPGPIPGRNFRNGLPQRIFLLDSDKQLIVGLMPPDFQQRMLLPIDANGDIVGWLGVASARSITQPEEQAFIMQLRQSLLIGLGLGLIVAMLLAWLLAKHLSGPINQVAQGIRELAAGNFGEQLESSGGDEISRLTDDVNRLSSTLSEHESSRKRWMSDMAHELRTPLAIISGELEAMSDGIRPLDTEHLASVQEEVKHLSSLVDDLHSLTLTDSGALAYKMRPLDFNELLQLALESFSGSISSKGLQLNTSLPDDRIKLLGDEHRLRQLLHNLLDNAVRYTDAGGSISVDLSTEGQQAKLVISDSAPGAGEDECEKLFQRLYRIEGSRNRNSGGSGLGLAICRNIVEAHGGQIHAKPSAQGGLQISAVLPLNL